MSETRMIQIQLSLGEARVVRFLLADFAATERGNVRNGDRDIATELLIRLTDDLKKARNS